jgi:type I restriction enzyme S subunit
LLVGDPREASRSRLQPRSRAVEAARGGKNPSRNGSGTFRYVDIAGIDRELKRIARAEAIPCSDAPSRARKEVRAGDVVVSTVRPNLNAIAQIPEDLDGEIASTGFAVLRANPKLVDSRYLFYRAQHQEFVDYLVANATGASYPAVSDSIVRRAALPLPPPKEQFRIIELLDEADRLRKLRRDADAKAARILPALFLKMFGDPATNPKRLPTKVLGNGDVCDINPRARSALVDSTPVSFVPMADVDEILGRIVGCQVRPYAEVKKGFTSFADGDVLFAKITPCMQNGKAAIANGLTNAIGFGSTEFHVLRPGPESTAEFLFALVRLQSFRNHAMTAFTGSAGQQRVPVDFLKQYRIPLPPISEMQEFSKLSRLISDMLVDAERAARKLEMQFSVLLQRAYSGQLTAKWREAHLKELLAEMEVQARLLNLPMRNSLEVAQ